MPATLRCVSSESTAVSSGRTLQPVLVSIGIDLEAVDPGVGHVAADDGNVLVVLRGDGVVEILQLAELEFHAGHVLRDALRECRRPAAAVGGPWLSPVMIIASQV